MMIQAIRLTRKKAALAVILAGAVLAALILLLGQHGGNVGASEQPCLSSNGERVAYLRELGWEIEVCQISVSRGKSAGELTMMLAQNPVWLITGTKT